MTLAFSPAAEQRIDDLVKRYPDRQGALIPVLYVAQREFGYLTSEALALVARRLDLPETKVLTTATFYTMLRKRPVGRYHLQICHNVACYLRGSDELVAVAKKKLGIGMGETTPDKLFTLEGVECLAACGTAPALQVNEDYHEDMTPEQLERLIDELRAASRSGGGA